MFATILKAAFVVLLLVSMSPLALAAAGSCAGDAISDAAISVTNGGPTCHINDNSDKVELSSSGIDLDDMTGDCGCQTGNRIDLAATEWRCTTGSLDFATGSTSKWKAGTDIGTYTVTAILHDKDDGAVCHDDKVDVSIILTAFKVGVHLGTSSNSSTTEYEDSPAGYDLVTGTLDLDHILITDLGNDAANSVATWTLVTSPDGAAMKQEIHAKAHAQSWSRPSDPAAKMSGVATDSDWFDDDDECPVDITVTAGLVTIGISITLPANHNVSVCGAGVAFGSQVHGDYSRKIELVSETLTEPTAVVNLGHTPDDAWIVGKVGTHKAAEWEAKYDLQRKLTQGNSANAEIDIFMRYKWSLTDTKPFYGGP